MTYVYLLKGRSIDGTVYRTAHGWVDHPGMALACNTHEGIKGLLAEARFANESRDADSVVGGLEITTLLLTDWLKRQSEAYAAMEREQAEWEEQA